MYLQYRTGGSLGQLLQLKISHGKAAEANLKEFSELDEEIAATLVSESLTHSFKQRPSLA